MTNHGDDCYFFYYSTCAKGDGCPYRHCEAAMGSEIVCNLWQEGRCFRTVCKFRHMEITKNRKEICCYWESQPAGCQKPHCAFFHERPRCIDGVFVPPDKSLSKTEEQPHEEPAPLPAAPLPTAANPQLRGVIKTETQEPVPSPTHPPVVINPADDDEDEDDQFSEEGEDGKVGPSPRKLLKSDDSLSFGVSTLEEIRLRKALKASMKRAGYPIQSSDTSANGEMENIRSLFRPTFYEAGDDSLIFEETGRRRGTVAERLGRKMPNTDLQFGDGVSLRRGLTESLGTFGDGEEPFLPPYKAPEQIRIKTLEEIRQEKAAKSQSQSQKENPSDVALKTNRPKTTKGVKRAITIRDGSVSNVKTFSEVLRAKKKRQEEQDTDSKMSRGESDPATPDPEAANVGQLRVKTLEEIRMEKAAKIQTLQTMGAETKKSPGTEENGAKKPPLLKELDSQTGSVTTEKSAEVTEKPVKTPPASPETRVATSNGVKVKTFEEIMREKRLRKQEMEEQAKDSAEAEPAQKHTDGGTLKRKVPAKISLTSPRSSPPSSTTVAPDSTLSTQKLPVGKPIVLKSKAASPLYSTTHRARGAAVKAATSVLVKQNSPPLEAESDSQSPSCSREVPDKNTRSSTALSPAKQDRVAATALTSDKTQNNNPKKSPEHIADTTNVRPKLNVKPSVMKPAAQVKPGQKRWGAERSAVAAVKPLSSTSTVLHEPQQETASRDRQEIPSSNAEAQLSSAAPRSPSTLLDSGSGCSPLREDLQTVPVFKQSLNQDPKQTSNVAAASEACTVPQSPLLKTQTKSRRLSVAASRTAATSSATASNSAMDDFEELINEFTDDHLEEDVDPGIGEDDLLQELSEMIDS